MIPPLTQISPPTKLIMFVVVLLATTLGFLSIKHLVKPTRSWYDHAWNYRIPLTLSNAGSSQSNYDVLIELDTATLVTAGKLQSDCDDLRFLDSNDSTVLDYWIEIGCNTDTTLIWVRLPSLPSGNTTIYLYYGNAIVSSGALTWAGEFTLLADASCPAGWTTNSDFNNRFPYGSATEGTLGGADSHSHVNLSGNSGTSPSGSYGAGGQARILSHTHTYDIAVATANILPPYLDLVFCSSAIFEVNSPLIALFNASVPSGWTRFSTLDGYYPRGSATYGATGGTSTHTHTTDSGTTGSYGGTAGTWQGTSQQQVIRLSISSHTHSIPASSLASASHLPPYLNVIFGEVTNVATIPSDYQVIALADIIPPLGWTRFSALDAKFPVGNEAYGGTGGSATHSHTYSINTGTGGGDAGSIWDAPPPNNSFAVANHAHVISGTSDSVSTLPPYRSTLYVLRNSNSLNSISVSQSAEENSEAPNIPTLVAPTNLATGVHLLPDLVVSTTDNEGDYVRYKITLCDDAGMTTNCQVFDQTVSQTGWSGQDTQSGTAYLSGSQATFTLQSFLDIVSTYYWKASAIDLGGSGSWGSTQATPFSFTTMSNSPPSAPATPWTEGQTNPGGVIDQTPEFSAIHNDVDGDPAVYYEIEVNANNAFTGTVMWDTGRTALSSLASGVRSPDFPYAGSALSWATTYYWRIRFEDDLGAMGAWSTTQSFTMNITPNTPALDFPGDQATTSENLTPPLKTTATDNDSDYLRYKIELCDNAGMTINCQTFDQTSSQTGWSGQNTQSSTAYTSGTQATYTLQTNLLPATTYYWRSYTIDPAGTNLWSATQSLPYSFTTTSAPLSASSCRLQESVDDSSLLVIWSDLATNEHRYEVQRSVNGGLWSVLATNLSANTTELEDQTIASGNSYRYRVAPYFLGPTYGEWCYTATLYLNMATFSIN